MVSCYMIFWVQHNFTLREIKRRSCSSTIHLAMYSKEVVEHADEPQLRSSLVSER